VLNRYEAFKKGDYVTSSNPIPAELAGGAANNLSLIDFDEGGPSTNPISLASGPDDLVGLFAGPSAASNSQIPAAQAVPPTYAPSPMAPQGNGYGMGMIMGGAPGVSRATMSPPTLSGTPPASIMLPGTPNLNTYTPSSFGDSGHAVKGPIQTGSGTGMGANMGAMFALSSSPALQSQKPQANPASNATAQNQVQGKDPFADLAGLF